MDQIIALFIFTIILAYFINNYTTEHFNFHTQEHNIHTPKFDNIFYRNQLLDLQNENNILKHSPDQVSYDPNIYNKDRDISDIYDELVEGRYVRDNMPKIYNDAIKIDGLKKPGYNGNTLELNNWSYYDDENFINGGAHDGIYANDMSASNFAAI
jgi:hypothetical protein